MEVVADDQVFSEIRANAGSVKYSAQQLHHLRLLAERKDNDIWTRH